MNRSVNILRITETRFLYEIRFTNTENGKAKKNPKYGIKTGSINMNA